MKEVRVTRMACAIMAVLAGTTATIAATGETLDPQAKPNKPTQPFVTPPRVKPLKVPPHAVAPIPTAEPSVAPANAGFATASAFSAASPVASPASQTLSGPVSLDYNGSAIAFSLTQAGTSRGLSASVTNTKDAGSALYVTGA